MDEFEFNSSDILAFIRLRDMVWMSVPIISQPGNASDVKNIMYV